MTRPLALLRPEPGWSASAAAARDAGLRVIGHPLFVGEPMAWRPPDAGFDVLLVGSAAVFRLGGAGLNDLKHLPVHAVGRVTAAAARAAGFAVARTGEGGLQHLLDGAAGELIRYLRLVGEQRVTLDPHSGQSITECVVYRLAPAPIEAKLHDELVRSEPVVALHSAAAAAHFAREVDRLGIAREAMLLLALGARVAEAAGAGWAARHIADRPEDAALLAKAVALCK